MLLMETCLGQEVREGFLEELTLDLRLVKQFQANGGGSTSAKVLWQDWAWRVGEQWGGARVAAAE